MSLLGLQAVDRKDDLIDRFVLAPQGFGVLMSCGEHYLVELNVLGNGIVGEFDSEARLTLGCCGAAARAEPMLRPSLEQAGHGYAGL
jgi:hypothetical protein